jgi:hypothetical protein
MSGYHTIIKFRRMEEQVNALGFMFCYPKHRYNDTVDMVALKPKDADAVPIYSRDAEVFSGTLDQLEVWLRGIEWARDYDRMLRISDDKKRAKKEDEYRHNQLVSKLAKDHANA